MSQGLINVKVEQNLGKALHNLGNRLGNASVLMAGIAAELLNQTEQAFESEGPNWASLAPTTLAARTKQGTWPGRILQVNSELAASIQTHSTPTYARIGSNKAYAGIHQFGGQAGRNGSVDIPARPYLPIDEDGNLSQRAETALLNFALSYLQANLHS